MKFLDVAADVRALRLGQAGRQQSYRLGAFIDAKRAQRLEDALVGAQNAGHLIHCGGLERDRFAKVIGEKHLAEGGAALRAVHERHGARQAKKGQGRAHGLADL